MWGPRRLYQGLDSGIAENQAVLSDVGYAAMFFFLGLLVAYDYTWKRVHASLHLIWFTLVICVLGRNNGQYNRKGITIPTLSTSRPGKVILWDTLVFQKTLAFVCSVEAETKRASRLTVADPLANDFTVSILKKKNELSNILCENAGYIWRRFVWVRKVYFESIRRL